MGNVKVKLDKDGLRELLKSEPIKKELRKAGEEVNTLAGGGYDVDDWERPSRAVVNVADRREGAMFREAAEGNLARAVGKG